MKYIKKPVVIEAIQWTGENAIEVDEFCGSKENVQHKNGELYICTLEGEMKANKNDYIIKGIKGEFYPCKPDIFVDSYESLEEHNKRKIKILERIDNA